MIDFEIDHNSIVPLHAQVEDMLRKLIEKPEYRNGKLLSNEINIAKRLGISRSTVWQATNKLVYESLLVRKKRMGTSVAKNNISIRLSKWTSFTHEMYETLEEQHYIVASVSKEGISAILADSKISKLLNVRMGNPILFHKRAIK